MYNWTFKSLLTSFFFKFNLEVVNNTKKIRE